MPFTSELALLLEPESVPPGNWPPPEGNLDAEGVLSGRKPKPAKFEDIETSIWLNVWFIDALVSLMVFPRFDAIVLVASWFAINPAGMEIMIDREIAKAIITKSDRTLRLAKFLVALLNMPNFSYPNSVIAAEKELL
jgi:hypothetical protein